MRIGKTAIAVAIAAMLALMVLARSAPVALPWPAQSRSGTTQPPRLVVFLIVDQMRADYVDRFRNDWTGGLKRLLDQGARFSRAAYPYLNTVTCPGHATIATGAFPYAHGVSQNAWLDRDTGRQVTCTEDPNVQGVGYGVTRASGESGYRLLLPTFADQMRAQRGARVVTLSLKARSAIMLAGHGGDAVTWLSAALDGWQTSSAFSRTPIPAVQQFVDTASIAADYGQSWKPLLPADRYLDPDEGEGEAPPAGWKQAFPHVLSGEGDKPDMAFLNQWQHSPFADAYLGRFAAALVEAMALGARDGTDVLGISFSSPDFVGHAFGPRSREVQDIYARLDQTLGTLFERLDTLVGRNRYLVAFTSDHGVAVRPEERGRPGPEGGRLNLPMVRDAIDRVAQAAAGPGKYLVRGSAATNDLYFEPGMYDRLRTRPGALGSVIDRLQEEPGIAGVFRSEQLSAATSAPDALLRAAALSYVPERSGELVLALAPGWMYAPGGTSHGTANAYDQQVPMFFMGEGIRAGEYPEAATPADIAPTLAALSGIAMPQAEGRVLHSALAARSPESTGRSTSDGTRPNPAAPPSAAAKDR